jgi:hypothetical protein
MRREEKIELILKILGNNGWKISQEERDKLYNRKGKINSHLLGSYDIGKKTICKDKDYIFIDGDEDFISIEGDYWKAVITLYPSGCGYYIIIPILYHTITEKNKINFACNDYNVDLTHINTEEEIADVIAQCEEKINQVKFKVKEYEAKIREQKMKKDF